MVLIEQSTLPEIIETEHRLVMSAAERYREYYKYAEAVTAFISLFAKSVPPTLPIFARFWSLTKNTICWPCFRPCGYTTPKP